MEKISFSPSKDLQSLKLQIDGFNDSFEILKIKEEGLTVSYSSKLNLLQGSPLSGQINSRTLDLQFRFQGNLQKQTSRPDGKGFILEIRFHQKARFPDVLIALELAS
ncbi:hypothetical protein [Leptospira borgpetersenii]|uniref:Uncharacterized protein n=2 Tax=Leptospira borgpetersenii serovar Hardjo-bovis TaxID=338217 RepID=Q04RE1_LEPBJ|nr:hypothetical protein [Leptospira borgpetersenii]ABJ76529.1 Hypothetical protein LBJ_2021 [Leptospira borgpetersenii serovar Hardjo-bovis str. JB197]ABJ78558.1 Hypothetical protein LBL_1029 [Leptospira borgpetersenii serovar Hardjo-bovis str. L550]AMX57819.1 hypothetical protein LBK6_05475 [Leptospira borgpetersenii serovar Hardjo]AMX61052.1 hypothetical protein LBK9_05410 [Leptospira borgpetersenii serovar Hardjo]AMX64295.1 hypothetical protein LBK30_05440 [Leptospira borgpetersenii serovar